MGAKRPTTAEVKPVIQEVVKTAATQLLPLFWNINTVPATIGLGRALPLIENLLPLFSSVSPLLSTALPVIETVVRVGTQIRQAQNQSQSQSQSFGGPYLEQIKTLAENSSCMDYIWKNGAKAPVGFVKGMALSFARSSCRLKKSESAPSALVNVLINAVTKKNPLDALLSYKNIFADLGLSLNTSGADPLRAVFLLNMGTSMADNGGVYCKISNMMGSQLMTGVLSKLFSEYRGGNALRCFADIFQEGTNCSGTTKSALAFNQACPAFGAEVGATMLRLQSTSYQSIASKQAEIAPACDELLKSVQDMIDQDPVNTCADIF